MACNPGHILSEEGGVGGPGACMSHAMDHSVRGLKTGSISDSRRSREFIYTWINSRIFSL